MLVNPPKNKGFTLIELLVVVSIISLLSSIVFASLSSARIKGRDSVRIQNLIQIRNALALYASYNNSNYPIGSGGGHFFSTLTSPSLYAWSDLQTALLPYIKTLPQDPSNDATHYYYFTTSFSTGWMTSGAEGTCLGKAVLVAISTEGGTTRRDCTLNSGAEQFPNELVLQIN